MDSIDHQWTETVEDLVDGGEIDKAITLLENIISNLEQQTHNNLRLSTALFDLSKLYSIKGFSLKADEASNRAILIKQQSPLPKGNLKEEALAKEVSDVDNTTEDDWEAIADCTPEELLSPISKISIKDPPIQTIQSINRRGRGNFAYKKQGLYSDQKLDEPVYDETDEDSVSNFSEEDTQFRIPSYGTRHVLVLSDFPPSIEEKDIERLFKDFKGQGLAIRWINDTVALVVFRSPSEAFEASKKIQSPFTVRVLDENDQLIKKIPTRDLEPPRQRPQTSARTAQRLIAHSMGIKLPYSSFGARELRKQEEDRRNRIVSRQNLRDNAWGDE